MFQASFWCHFLVSEELPLVIQSEQVCWLWIFLAFLYMRLSLLHPCSWRTLSLDTEFCVGIFCQHFRNVPLLWPAWFLIKICSHSNCSIIVFLWLLSWFLFRYQHFDYDVSAHGFLWVILFGVHSATRICSICLLSNLGNFFQLFIYLLFVSCSYWIIPIDFIDLTSSCHFPVSSPQRSGPIQWIFYLNYCIFQKSSKVSVHSSLYLLFLCFSFLPICFKSVHPSSLPGKFLKLLL